MQQEIYKKIKEYPEYEVSNLGNVKKLTKLLKLSKHRQGYLTVSLKGKSYLVHRIVAKTFIGFVDNSLEVNHKNGIKSDNRFKNLEWVTPKENIKHAYDLGLRTKPNIRTIKKMSSSHQGLHHSQETKEKIKISNSGEKSKSSKLNWKIINEIRKNIDGLPQWKLAKKYGVVQQHISDIVNNKKWCVIQ